MSAAAIPIELPDAVVRAADAAVSAVFGPYMDLFESSVRTYAPSFSKTVIDYAASTQSPLSADLPLMHPLRILGALSLYPIGIALFFLLGKLTGKQEMRFVGIVHNFILVWWSLYMTVGILWEAVNQDYSLFNNPSPSSGAAARSMAKFSWIFLFSKFPEFVDTFIMLMKQNYRQVSFLHVFHHSSIVLVSYEFVRQAPAGDAYWSPILNSAVHTVMYTYYLLMLLFRDEASSVRKFLGRYKFWITKGQMTQFVLILAQCIYGVFIVPVGEYKWVRQNLILNMVYMMMMLALFGNFLLRNKGKAKKGGDKGGAASTAARRGGKKKE